MSDISPASSGISVLLNELLGKPLQVEDATADRPRVYRIILAFGTLLMVGFGAFFRQAGPEITDPLGIRIGLAVLGLGIVGASYLSGRIRRQLGRLYRGYIYLVVTWYGGLLIANQFAWSYGLGAVFLHAAAGLTFGVGLRQTRPHGWFLGLLTITWLGGGLTIAAPQTPLFLLTLSLGGIAVLIFVVTRWRIRSERQLRTSRHRYQQLYQEHESIFETARESIILIDRKCHEGKDRFEVRRINASHEERLGSSSEEVRGETPREMLGPEAGAKVSDRLRQCVEENEPVDCTLQVPTSGGHRHFHSKLTPIDTNDEITGVLVIARDITEQQKREQALREQERILEQIRQNVTDVIWMSSPDGKIEFVSKAFEDIWGRPVSDLREEARETVLEGMHPEDRDRVRTSMETRRDRPEDYDEIYRIVQPDGDMRWVRDRASGIYDEEDRLVGLVGIATDITERKRREEQLRLLDRLIQHDLRGDVTNAQGWAEMVANGTDPQESSNRIQSATGHMMEILEATDALQRALRSGQRVEQEPVSLRSYLEGAIQTVGRRFPDARISAEYHTCESTYVQANELLGSVFENLIANGVRHNDQAIPEVQIRTEHRNGRARVEVADNGPGIPANQRKKIFREDQRGLESPGMGLGLYLVKTLVRLYGGEVELTENEPRGARFIVKLHRVEVEST